MADISMCVGENCPIKETCYRYMADPNPFQQSYGEFKYIDGKCNFFKPLDYKLTKY